MSLTEIILTIEGDKLIEFNGGPIAPGQILPLGFAVGLHKHCCGSLVLSRSSGGWNALHCGKCKLRVSIPSVIDTYDGLMIWFSFNKKEKPMEDTDLQVVSEETV